MNHCVALAKKAVENYINKGELIMPPAEPSAEILQKRAGTFITIKKEGQLRACVGTYLPTRPTIAEEIIRNAVAAATEDYRFGPIKKEELPRLSYEVCILGDPELVEEISSLDPSKFGIIVKTAPLFFPNQEINVEFDGRAPDKTGVLLPGIEEIDTAEKQFALACQKGKIDPEKEKVFVYRFSAEKHY